MSIRLKTFGSIIVTFLVLFLIIYLASRQVILGSFAQLEQQNTLRNVERLVNTLSDEVADLSLSVGDYAFWDDTVAFVQGEYPEYPDDNFTGAIVENLSVSSVIITDLAGEVVYSASFTDNTRLLPQAAIDQARQVAAAGVITDESPLAEVGGLVALPDTLALIATRAILPTEPENGQVSGYFTYVRYLDAGQIDRVSDKLRFEFDLFALNDSLPPDLTAMQAALSPDNPLAVNVIDDSTVGGYALLTAMNGEAVGIARIQLPREIYARGVEAVQLLAAVLLIMGAVMSLATALLVERLAVARITRLSREVDEISRSGSLSRRVAVGSNDEVTTLGQNINTLLSQLSLSQQELTEKNETLAVAYLQAEEATQLKSEFLSTISHELRTPLNAIIGYSEIMLMGINGTIDDSARRMISSIQSSGEHLLVLVNNLLDLSKIEAGFIRIIDGEIEVQRLARDVHDQMEVLSAQRQLAFHVKVADNVPMRIIGDRERLMQILINLLSNAFKFTHEGEVRLDIMADGTLLKLLVRDTGIGIPPHALAYIFEEFRQGDGSTTREYGGTGLGLAIVRKLAVAMNGKVEVESEVGKGSLFIVTLPLRVPSAVTDVVASVE